MATFLVERYWPGITPAGVAAATAGLTATSVLVLETIVAGDDEVCFWTVEAASADEAAAAFAMAGVAVDRVAAATSMQTRTVVGDL